jgi:hypothetical protein
MKPTLTLLSLFLVAGAAGAQPNSENTAVACRDGVDNDQNGKTDCADPGCGELVFCQSHASADAENTAAACRDLYDNDHDGHTDCDDQDCEAFVFCAEGHAGSNASSAPRGEPTIHRGRGVRWGLGAHPGTVVLTGSVLGVSSTTALGGAGFSGRLGYQFNRWAGLYAEPYFSFMAKDSQMVITMAGGVLAQFNAGMATFSVGPLLGGFATCLDNKCQVLKFSTNGGRDIDQLWGGFVARVGVDLMQRNRLHRGSSAMSLAVDFRPLFTVVKVGSTTATSAVIGLNLTLGYDSY